MPKKSYITGLLGLTLLVSVPAKADTQIVIASVNNTDMVRMQALTTEFEKQNPDIKVSWTTSEENQLRAKVTTDIATNAGQFDIVTIGNYETPVWAKLGWLRPLDDLGPNYEINDLIPKVRASLSYNGKLYASPFYGESSMTYYRKDLFRKAGLSMPDQPTWSFIEDAAKKLTDRQNEVYGICLRGQANWGGNINIITAMANSYGARWFDENWKPQFNQMSWKRTLTDYVKIMQEDGPPSAATMSPTEALGLFVSGKCGIFIDATVFGSVVTDPKQSSVSNDVGFAPSPNAGLSKSAVTLWVWALAIPSSSKNKEAAQKFIAWATSPDYIKLVAAKYGVREVPPGTRTSLYTDQAYLESAPFAKIALADINAADPEHPTVDPVPYVGVQFVAIPQFQLIGTSVGQLFSGAVAGNLTVEQALEQAQSTTTRIMQQAGYYK